MESAMEIARNDFVRPGRALRDDPDAWYDEMRADQFTPVTPESWWIAYHGSHLPHPALRADCPFCGATTGQQCVDELIAHPLNQVHFARTKEKTHD